VSVRQFTPDYLRERTAKRVNATRAKVQWPFACARASGPPAMNLCGVARLAACASNGSEGCSRQFPSLLTGQRHFEAFMGGDKAEALVEPVGVGPPLVGCQLNDAAPSRFALRYRELQHLLTQPGTSLSR
jgi:hypothetical protein